jgi:hypothetical protein
MNRSHSRPVPQWLVECQLRLKATIDASGQTFYFIEDPSRTNQSAFLRVFAIRANEPIDTTALIASAIGIPLRERNGDLWLLVKGYGLNRSAHVCDTMARKLGINASNIHAVIL